MLLLLELILFCTVLFVERFVLFVVVVLLLAFSKLFEDALVDLPVLKLSELIISKSLKLFTCIKSSDTVYNLSSIYRPLNNFEFVE